MTNLAGKINTRLELINEYKQALMENISSNEVSSIFDPNRSGESIGDKIKFSFVKARLVLNYYINNNAGKVLFVFFVLLALVFFTSKIRSQIYPDNISGLNETARLVLAHRFLTPAFLCLTVLQFVFPHPPVIFYGLIWVLSSVILSVILWKHLSGSAHIFWMYLFTAFILTLTIDLMLKVSQIERWIMLFIALSGIFVSVSVYKKMLCW